MLKWILPVLFAILLNYSALWAASIETPDIGRNTLIDFQLFQFPIEPNPQSNAGSEKKEKGETIDHQKSEKDILDKKVDDAIKKALEEK